MKNGDILPCGGKVTFVSSTGYYFAPASGGSRQWVTTQANPAVVIDYAALRAAQCAEERERELAADRRCAWEYTPEGIAEAEIRRAEIAVVRAAKALIVTDNAAAIALLETFLPLTVEQVQSLPHSNSEYVDHVTPKYGAVIKTYRAHRNAHSNRQSKIDLVAEVKTGELTLAMVQVL